MTIYEFWVYAFIVLFFISLGYEKIPYIQNNHDKLWVKITRYVFFTIRWIVFWTIFWLIVGYIFRGNGDNKQ